MRFAINLLLGIGNSFSPCVVRLINTFLLINMSQAASITSLLAHSSKTDREWQPKVSTIQTILLLSIDKNNLFRDEVHGSWFIQELCSKINSLAGTHDLESIITEVKREVAINKEHEEYNKRTLEWDVNKQMPVVTSTLIRKLYLRKFGEVPEKAETFPDMKRLSVSSDTRNEVLDSSVASAPLLVQFGPCSCFLDHFNYMRNCLR